MDLSEIYRDMTISKKQIEFEKGGYVSSWTGAIGSDQHEPSVHRPSVVHLLDVTNFVRTCNLTPLLVQKAI